MSELTILAEKAAAVFYALAQDHLDTISVSPYPKSDWSLPMVGGEQSRVRYIFSERGLKMPPSPGNMFDGLRKWGSIAQLSVDSTGGIPFFKGWPVSKWMCRVVFCFSYEAQRFEENCRNVSGWDV